MDRGLLPSLVPVDGSQNLNNLQNKEQSFISMVLKRNLRDCKLFDRMENKKKSVSAWNCNTNYYINISLDL